MTNATCSDTIAAKGSKIFICTTAPSTYDAAGFDALTWVQIGMVEDIGEFGPEADIGEFTPLDTGIKCKFMGASDYGELSLTIAKTTTDDGLTALLAHQGSVTPASFKVELSKVGTTTQGHTTPAKHQRYMFSGLTKSAKVSINKSPEAVRIMSAIVPIREFIEGAFANSAA